MLSWIIGAASPFNGWEEFEGAVDGPTGGAIYTFADRPALIGIMVIVAALVFLYFIYAAFQIKAGESGAKSPPALGLLLVAGAASAMATLYEGWIEREAVQQASRPGKVAALTQQAREMPIALIGMTGLAGTTRRKSSRRGRRLRDR